MELALGRFFEPPFKPEVLDEVRRQWAAMLKSSKGALLAAGGQPFFLDLMAQSLEVFDFEILVGQGDTFANGVPVGYDAPLPRAPAVSRREYSNGRLMTASFRQKLRISALLRNIWSSWRRSSAKKKN